MGAGMLAGELVGGSVIGIEKHLPDNLAAGRGVVLHARLLVLQARRLEIGVCHCGDDCGNREIGNDVAAHRDISLLVYGMPFIPLLGI